MGVAAAVDGVEWWACHAPAAKWKDEAACGCSACGRFRLWLVGPGVGFVESSESILVRRPRLFLFFFAK